MKSSMVRKGKGGGAGQQIVQATAGTGGFTTSSATLSATVRKLVQGSGVAVNDSITVVNPLAIWGTPGVYGYAGAEGTTLTAIQSADDGTWQILDIVPTVCACPCNTGTDLGSEGGGGGL